MTSHVAVKKRSITQIEGPADEGAKRAATGEEKRATLVIGSVADRRRQLREARSARDRAEVRASGTVLLHYIAWAKQAMAARPMLVLAEVAVAAARGAVVTDGVPDTAETGTE